MAAFILKLLNSQLRKHEMQNQVATKEMDSLLKTRIPMKRTAQQRLAREKEQAGSDEDKQPDLDSDFDDEVNLEVVEKRLNDGVDGLPITHIELSSGL